MYACTSLGFFFFWEKIEAYDIRIPSTFNFSLGGFKSIILGGLPSLLLVILEKKKGNKSGFFVYILSLRLLFLCTVHP